MAIILRRDKGSTLTHNELDDNFQELLNRANLDSDLVKKFTLDSADAITLIDSDYIQFRRPPEAVFGVTNNGTSAWRFNGDGFPTGVDNPTLYLHRGLEYKFEMNALGHPLEFRLSNGGTIYSAGVTGRGTQVGDITFTPPFDAPSSLVYQCTNHASMVGDIVILDKMDSSSVTGLIDSAYIQQRVPESYLETLIDSDYVQSRVTLRDSSFVTGIVDSSYFSLFVDSSYIATRSSSSGGIGSIQLITTASSVTKVGDGDVFVELAGGGGGGSSASSNGGSSYGRGVFHNVADGSVITVSAIGAGGAVYGVHGNLGGTGGSTTVYVDSANGQKLVMAGGTGASTTAGGGYHAHIPAASGGATALPGPMGKPGIASFTGGSPSGLGIGGASFPASQANQIGYGVGALYNHGAGPEGNGTPGAVLLIGV